MLSCVYVSWSWCVAGTAKRDVCPKNWGTLAFGVALSFGRLTSCRSMVGSSVGPEKSCAFVPFFCIRGASFCLEVEVVRMEVHLDTNERELKPLFDCLLRGAHVNIGHR